MAPLIDTSPLPGDEGGSAYSAETPYYIFDERTSCERRAGEPDPMDEGLVALLFAD